MNCLTEDALTALSIFMNKALELKLLRADICLILEKAFDSLFHRILKSTLEAIGARGNALECFWSHLSHRHIYIEEYLLNIIMVNFDVPQGLILCQLLFLIHLIDPDHILDPNFGTS